MAQSLPILSAHMINDTYTGSVAPLLPVLIDKLSLGLTAAGSLNAALQLPALINPLIGLMADRTNLRYFVIFAPAITGTMIGMIGFAPSYWTAIILLFAAGVSNAMFHAPAPAMVARASGRRVGLGMGLFLAAGETGFALGPLLAVWVVSTWTLDGYWRVMVIGWAASLILFFRMRNMEAPHEKPGSIRAVLPLVWRLFIPLVFFNLFRNPLIEAVTTYLPIYMDSRGASLWLAGSSLTIIELAGIPGALLIGPLSDRIGRKPALLGVSLAGSLLMLLFRTVDGWLLLPVLALVGFTVFANIPITLAIVQEQFPNNRAAANGLYMMVMFALRPIGTLFVGLLGDNYGLSSAYLIAGLTSLLMLPAILSLPKTQAPAPR